MAFNDHKCFQLYISHKKNIFPNKLKPCTLDVNHMIFCSPPPHNKIQSSMQLVFIPGLQHQRMKSKDGKLSTPALQFVILLGQGEQKPYMSCGHSVICHARIIFAIFINKYLHLQETILHCMKNRFKKERVRLVSVEEVKAAKSRFGSPGTGRKTRKRRCERRPDRV